MKKLNRKQQHLMFIDEYKEAPASIQRAVTKLIFSQPSAGKSDIPRLQEALATARLEEVLERIRSSAEKSTIPCEGGMQGDSDAWHSIRNATIRVLRRELGLSKHGMAPDDVYNTACDMADKSFGMRGWSTVFENAALELADDVQSLIDRYQR